jgi:signal peptidase I
MDSEAKNLVLPNWLRTVLIGRSPKRTLLRIVVLVVTCVTVFKFILLPIRVQGPSMLPTYQSSGLNFVNCLAYARSEPKRGDVVAIELAGRSIMYMKRIVGLPGETVAFHEGRLWIDGKVLDEPYQKLGCNWERAPVTLGSQEYFVVGDNRSMREADHVFGETSRSRIVGKVLLCKNLFASWLR